MEENTSSEARTLESIKGTSNFSERLLLSILCSVVGLGILSLLIFMIPNINYTNGYITDPDTRFDNFFYDVYDTGYSWSRFRVGAGLGYYVLMPVAVCLILISGTTILINKNREKVILILSNLALYIVPIVMGWQHPIQNQLHQVNSRLLVMVVVVPL